MKTPQFTKSAVLTAAVVIGIAGAGVGVSHAATAPENNRPANKLISALAQKFNLKEDDIQKVFEEQRGQMEAQHEQAAQDRLTKAVADKKLTQDQANAIKAKQTEMKAIMESLKDKTKEERAATMKTQMETLKKWATDNKIPKEYLPLGGPRMEHGYPGFRKGFMGHRLQNDNDGDDTQQAPQQQ